MKEERILAVDDERDILFYLSSLINSWGYSVTSAAGGREAISLLEKEAFDLLIVDLKMPEVSGLSVLRRAKELKLDSMVIVLSGHLDLYSALELIKIGGIYECMFKPIEEDRLKASVEKALEHKRLLNQAREMAALAHEKEKLESVIQLVITLHHEINNPLASILGNAQLMQMDKKLSKEMRSKVQSIEAQALKIKEIVQKLESISEVKTVKYLGKEKMIAIEKSQRTK